MTSYYANYGKIKHVYFYYDAKCNYCAIITYASAIDAETILSIHTNYEHSFIFHPPQNDNTERSTNLTKINRRQEECVIDIEGGSNFPNPNDTSDFNSENLSQAREIVLNGQPNVLEMSDNDGGQSDSFHVVAEFGEFVTEIFIYETNGVCFEKILKCINLEGAKPSKKITIKYTNLNDKVIEKTAAFLWYLENFTLCACFGSVLKNCMNLNSLVVYGEFRGVLINAKFPVLESFSLKYLEDGHDDDNNEKQSALRNLNSFLVKKIEIVKISYPDFLQIFINMFHALTQLQELIMVKCLFGNFVQNLHKILLLKNLKVLHIEWASDNEMLEFLFEYIAKWNQTLEFKAFTLKTNRLNYPSKSLIESIGKVKSLRTLVISFEEDLTCENLRQIRNNLPNLKEWCFFLH